MVEMSPVRNAAVLLKVFCTNAPDDSLIHSFPFSTNSSLFKSSIKEILLLMNITAPDKVFIIFSEKSLNRSERLIISAEKRVIPPPIIMNNISKEINAESNLFKPHPSNFLTTGNKMNEINKAILSGISTALANTITAKRPNMKANIKNNFWKDIFIGLKGLNRISLVLGSFPISFLR